MESVQFQVPNYVADIVVLNKDDKVVLLVEIKGTKLAGREAKQKAISSLQSYLQSTKKDIHFAMLADLNNIEIFQWNGEYFSEPIISLNTAEILSNYDGEFRNKKILEFYLETLVEAWLRDLAYHWKSETQPAAKELAEIGLLQQLAGGTTHSQVNLCGDTLR